MVALTAAQPNRHDDHNLPLDCVLCGDCLEVLKTLPSNSVSACVVDPPYGLGEVKDIAGLLTAWIQDEDDKPFTGKKGFMGKEWDSGVPGPRYWREVLRVLKPGAHILCFSGTRTVDLMTIALRLSGFQIKDTISWLYGSGFPKSLSIDKAIDRMRKDDIRHVCHYLRSALDASSYTVKSIAEHFGFHPRMVEHWAARDTDSQPSVPTWEQWLELKSLLDLSNDMDAEVWRLNGRKGKPGDAWYEREVIETKWRTPSNKPEFATQWGFGAKTNGEYDITAPATSEAQRYAGFGTALKPSHEPIILARKPLSEKSIAENVLKWNCGALNIDGCRVGNETRINRGMSSLGVMHDDNWQPKEVENIASGRFPSNLLLSHSVFCVPQGTKRVRGHASGYNWEASNNDNPTHVTKNIKSGVHYGDEEVEAWECSPECPILQLDRQSGIRKTGTKAKLSTIGFGRTENHLIERVNNSGEPSEGGASRYFQSFSPDIDVPFLYCSKSSRTERNRGCEGLPERDVQRFGKMQGTSEHTPKYDTPEGNNHPTVKPLQLMRWLIRLITPPNGTVLDCFAGSGSTLCAAVYEGVHFIGIEQDASYVQICEARIAHAVQEVR